MQIRKFIVAALLITAVTATAHASSRAYVTSGDIHLGFTPAEGFRLEHKSIAVFTESCLWVDYFNYGSDTIVAESRDIPGGKCISVRCKNPLFDGVQEARVVGDTVTFESRYHLLPSVSSKPIEYCAGFLSAPLVAGRAYRTESAGGGEAGIVPLKPIGEKYWDGILLKNPFKKIVFDSRIGKITVEDEGVPNDLQMYDWRALHVSWAEKHPVILLRSAFTQNPGQEVHSIVTVRIDPRSTALKPETAEAAASVLDMEGVRRTTPQPVVVIPEPKKMQLAEADFDLKSGIQVVVSDSAKEEDLRGVKSFVEEVKELYGIRLRIVRAKNADNADVILVGEASSSKSIAAASKSIGLSAPVNAEGYALSVLPHRIIVLGHDRRGTYYGMQTLKQLVKVGYDSTNIQGCTIEDYPTLSFRGAHLYTGNKALPFHKKLVDRIFSRYKMNELLLCVDQIQWKTNPKMAVPFSMTQSDVKKDVRYAREHFMDSIPQVSSLGHAEWAFSNHQNMNLCEDKTHPYVLCPTKKGSYDFLGKIFDEAIDLFDHPKYLHIGHDEATWGLAKFPNDPECKKRSVPDLFLMNTIKLHDYLKGKGVRTMMWGDMMLAPGSDTDACSMPDEKQAKKMRDSLPKDIVVTDWHYDISPADTFKSLGMFHDEGLKTIASTWYAPANIKNFSQAAKDARSLGLLQTTWAGFESKEKNLIDAKEQFTAFVLAADYAWNSGITNLDSLKYDPEQVFFSQWNRKPVQRYSSPGFCVDLRALYNVPLSDSSTEDLWVGKSRTADLSTVPVGSVRLKDDLFLLGKSTTDDSSIRLSSGLDGSSSYPKRIIIPVDRTAETLLFLHTCAWQDTPGRVIGSYKVNYDDGSHVEIPLVYRWNIAAWTDPSTASGATVAWKTGLPDGQRVSIREMTWKNPHPSIKIRSVEMSSSETAAGPVLLGLSGIAHL